MHLASTLGIAFIAILSINPDTHSLYSSTILVQNFVCEIKKVVVIDNNKQIDTRHFFQRTKGKDIPVQLSTILWMYSILIPPRKSTLYPLNRPRLEPRASLSAQHKTNIRCYHDSNTIPRPSSPQHSHQTNWAIPVFSVRAFQGFNSIRDGSFKLANTSKCPYYNSINIFVNDMASE
jgi:hypothetical protein